MKTYLWPKVLGGGEHEEYRPVSGETEAPLGTVAFLVDDRLVCIAVSLLTEVRPEPMPGTVVLDKHNRAWQHATCDRGDWCCTLDDLGADWEELNREHGPLLELGSAPEPVALPWAGESLSGSTLSVDVGTAQDIHLFCTGRLAVLGPDMADELGRALIAAAVAYYKAEREVTS